MGSIDPNLLIRLLDTIMLLVIGIISYRTHNVAVKTEINSNSMREELVKVTAIASRAEGKEEGRIEGEIKAAALDKGFTEGAGVKEIIKKGSKL